MKSLRILDVRPSLINLRKTRLYRLLSRTNNPQHALHTSPLDLMVVDVAVDERSKVLLIMKTMKKT